jgi:hypothetical protein
MVLKSGAVASGTVSLLPRRRTIQGCPRYDRIGTGNGRVSDAADYRGE